jgi:uncharacterized protein YcnI
MSFRAIRSTAVGALATGLLLAVPVAASAHVTVSSDRAVKGGYAKLVLRVPNESPTASTVKLVVTLPKDTPIASLRTKPKVGWTAVVTKAKLAQPVKTDDATLTEAPATVTYTATAGGIAPGQFDEFELSGGPLPTSADTLTLPTAQYYSDGKVVTWNEPNVAGQAEPQHPAPVLSLAASGEVKTTNVAATGSTEESETGNGLAVGLGIAALLVALIAAGLGFAALRRAGRGTPAGTAGA